MTRKIEVEYKSYRQTESINGPFIFIRDGNKIRNFEVGSI